MFEGVVAGWWGGIEALNRYTGGGETWTPPGTQQPRSWQPESQDQDQKKGKRQKFDPSSVPSTLEWACKIKEERQEMWSRI